MNYMCLLVHHFALPLLTFLFTPQFFQMATELFIHFYTNTV